MTRTTRFKRMAPAVILSAAAALGATASFATVASAATKGAVEKPNKGTITETGSTLMYPCEPLAPGYSTTYPSVAIQTAGTGSGTGITDASNGTADIGASDAYLSPAEVQATPALLNIPQAISAQLVVYNVPGVTAHLKLSGGILAEIYQGKITTWNDAAIAAVNPGVTLPSTPIVTLHRSDSSGDTFLFSSFLSATSPSWKSSIGFNTTVPWPNAPGALAENGNSGMVAGCKATVGCVAYVGISYLTQAPAVRPQLRRPPERPQAVHAAHGGGDQPGGGLLREGDAPQRDDLADLLEGCRLLPDHQLRVRHR